MEMGHEEYKNAIMAIATSMRILSMYDIPKILNAIERAETVAPFLDPTLWIKKNKAMSEDKEMFKAALPLYLKAKELLESMEKSDA